MAKQSKRCKKICKARAKAKQKVSVKQSVKQNVKVVVNCPGRCPSRKPRRKRRVQKQILPKGAYFDPFPQRLLSLNLMQRGMPQFSTPNMRAVRPDIPGAVRAPEEVDVDRAGADILGGRAMPNRWRNRLREDAWEGEGQLTIFPGTTLTRPPSPASSVVSSRGSTILEHPDATSSSSSGSAPLPIPVQPQRRRYATRYYARQLAREGASRFGGAVGRFLGPAQDLIDGFLGIGGTEPSYAPEPAPSVMSGESIGGGTASTGSVYRGR